MDMQADRAAISPGAAATYGRFEDRIVAGDQVGASAAFYDLVHAGRPLTEIIAEGAHPRILYA